MNDTLRYLKGKEWSMGNGQCPECCGANEKWLGHPRYLTSDGIGHERNCALAAAIRGAGGSPLYIGEFVSDKQFEVYITEAGFLSTRLKTEGGCPKFAALERKYREEMDEALLNALSGGG